MAICGEGVEYLIGGLVPHERFRVVVPAIGPGSDRVGEFGDGVAGSSSGPFVGEFRKPSFNEVQSIASGLVEAPDFERIEP